MNSISSRFSTSCRVIDEMWVSRGVREEVADTHVSAINLLVKIIPSPQEKQDEQIGKSQVIGTIIGGKTVYERNQATDH